MQFAHCIKLRFGQFLEFLIPIKIRFWKFEQTLTKRPSILFIRFRFFEAKEEKKRFFLSLISDLFSLLRLLRNQSMEGRQI